MVVVASYPNLENLILKSTIMAENYIIRNEIMKRFKDMLMQRSQTLDMKIMVGIVKIMILNIEPYSEKYETRSFSFYDGITAIIDNLTLQDIESLKS